MRKLIIFTVILLMVYYLLPIPSYALEPATASASLLEKLNILKKEIASKAASLKLDINKKLTNRFLSGEILSLNGNQITLSGQKNNVVSVNEYTTYQNSTADKKGVRKNKLELKDLITGDFIFALGDIDDKQILVARKIIKTDPLKSDNGYGSAPGKKTIWGRVQSAANSVIILKTKDGSEFKALTGPKTTYSSGKGEISPGDINTGSVLVVVGKTSGDFFQTGFIYQISSQSAAVKTKN